MRSPADLSVRLARQWQQGSVRVERLLGPGAWPLKLPIGKPSAYAFSEQTAKVQNHVRAWQNVSIGEVLWESVNYRAGATPVSMPAYWLLRSPSEWVNAAAEADVQAEYANLEHLAANVDHMFHSLLVRQRSLWRDKTLDEVIQVASLATRLDPGCANGRPLRLLREFGVDTKFFERHNRLLTRLLDERFDGEVNERGLIHFLNALDDREHWLLVVPLDRDLLTFRRQRVAASELAQSQLPGTCLLVVENEQCLHLLPPCHDTVAILGAGLNLQWLKSPWLDEKNIAYWGDMDTWGLLMLARARQHQPKLTALMMSQNLFEHYAPRSAVPEPYPAQSEAPTGLSEEETRFYGYLLNQDRGRLEQEFLPAEQVGRSLREWRKLQGRGTASIDL